MASTSAPIPSMRRHELKFSHVELRALVQAVDQVVYPDPGGAKVGLDSYKLLTLLHERLWQVLREDASGERGYEAWKEDVKDG